MSRVIPLHPPSLQEITDLTLPLTDKELLHLVETTPDYLTRICALAKIKNNILVRDLNKHQPSETYQSKSTSNPHSVFTGALLRFLRKGNRWGREERRLFYHVISLEAKSRFDEPEFRFLFNEITDILETHREKIQITLEFFSEVIATVDGGNCLFQRHFTTTHLNSMLMVANFLMEKAVLRDDQAIGDGLEDTFRLRVPEQQLFATLQLLHRSFCYDFIGERHNQQVEQYGNDEITSIIIPTKSVRPTTFGQFQKWLRNSEWIRIYQFIFMHCQLLPLKLIILEIFGDMARIHMKYFKNKSNFRIHLENVAYSLADALQGIKMGRHSEQNLQLALAVGRNLLKLVSPGVLPIFFQLNGNITKGLLDNVRIFLTEEIINQQILNTNILHYYFRFLELLHNRTAFEKTKIPLEIVQERIREISRCYETYLRGILSRISKQNFGKKSQAYSYRLDCTFLREALAEYNLEQLETLFCPFKLAKPRFTTANSAYELLVMLSAKIIRYVYVLKSYKLLGWQRQITVGSMCSTISKLCEWYSFTTYYRKRDNADNGFEWERSPGGMSPIRELYDEEIQNEHDYCHVLRITGFFIMQIILEHEFLFKNKRCFIPALYKLIHVLLQLTFSADLQESDNPELKNKTAVVNLQSYLEMSVTLVEKLLLRQFEGTLQKITKIRQSAYKQYYYRFVVEEGEGDPYIQTFQQIDKSHILECIHSIRQKQVSPQKDKVLLSHIFLLSYSLAGALKRHLIELVPVQTITQCFIYIQIIDRNPALVAISHQRENYLFTFIEEINQFIRRYEFVNQSAEQIESYIKVLYLLAHLGLAEISEEAINKLYLNFKNLLMNLEGSDPLFQMNDDIREVLKLITTDILEKSHDVELVQLSKEIRHKLLEFQQKDIQKIDEAVVEKVVEEIISNVNPIVNSPSEIKENIAVNEEVIEVKPLEIYNGYHRERTFQIMNKYINQSAPECSQTITEEAICTSVSQPSNQEQKRTSQSEQRSSHSQSTITLYTQTQNEVVQMEIQPIPMDIEGTSCKAKDYVQEISKLVEQSQQHISQHNKFECEDIGQMEEINEDLNEIDATNSQQFTKSSRTDPETPIDSVTQDPPPKEESQSQYIPVSTERILLLSAEDPNQQQPNENPINPSPLDIQLDESFDPNATILDEDPGKPNHPIPKQPPTDDEASPLETPLS